MYTETVLLHFQLQFSQIFESGDHLPPHTLPSLIHLPIQFLALCRRIVFFKGDLQIKDYKLLVPNLRAYLRAWA